MKLRLVPLFGLLVALLALAGCGGGGDDGGSSDPAALAPPGASLFLQGDVQPQGEAKANVEKLFEQISGQDTSPGDLIVAELEKAAGEDDEEFDFDKEVKPWLGEEAGMSFTSYDGEDFTGYAVSVQTTDADAAQSFIDAKVKEEDEAPKEGSYEGVDYYVDAEDGQTVGIVDDQLVFGEDETSFKAVVDAAQGESLADQENFSEAIDAAAAGSILDVYVDIGGLIDETAGPIDPDAQKFLDAIEIDPEEATAVASLVPGSDDVEIDLSAALGGFEASSGDASQMLGSLPASSTVALAAPDFGKRFGEAIDELDAEGIAGEVPPHKLKSGLKSAGIDLERIAAAVGDLGLFVEGSSESDVTAAAVLEAKNATEASNTVTGIGVFLRAADVPGVTALGGGVTGFTVRSADIGPQPIVVAAKGERIAIAYGLPAASRALGAGSAATLADDAHYKAAVAALGSTPIAGFADGPTLLKLIGNSVDPEDRAGFAAALPYLDSVEWVALGSSQAGDRATAKLLLGIGN